MFEPGKGSENMPQRYYSGLIQEKTLENRVTFIRFLPCFQNNAVVLFWAHEHLSHSVPHKLTSWVMFGAVWGRGYWHLRRDSTNPWLAGKTLWAPSPPSSNLPSCHSTLPGSTPASLDIWLFLKHARLASGPLSSHFALSGPLSPRCLHGLLSDFFQASALRSEAFPKHPC